MQIKKKEIGKIFEKLQLDVRSTKATIRYLKPNGGRKMYLKSRQNRGVITFITAFLAFSLSGCVSAPEPARTKHKEDPGHQRGPEDADSGREPAGGAVGRGHRHIRL